MTEEQLDYFGQSYKLQVRARGAGHDWTGPQAVQSTQNEASVVGGSGRSASYTATANRGTSFTCLDER